MYSGPFVTLGKEEFSNSIALTMHAYPTLPEAVEAAALSSCHAPVSPCADSLNSREQSAGASF